MVNQIATWTEAEVFIHIDVVVQLYKPSKKYQAV